MTNTSLFRQEALCQKNVNQYGTIILARPFSFLVLTAFSGIFLALSALFCCTFEFANTITVSGIILPKGELVQFPTAKTKRIIKSNVLDEQKIEKGGAMYVLSKELGQVPTVHGSIQNETALKDEELSLRKRLQDANLELNDIFSEIEIRRKRLALAEQALKEIETTERIGHQSSKQLYRKKDAVLQPQDIYVAVQSDVVASPNVAQVGKNIAPNRPLADTSNSQPSFHAVLYASSKDIGFVKPGQHVNIKYKAYPYKKFGKYGGVVKSVSLTPLASNENTLPPAAKEAVYLVNLDLEHQAIQAFGQIQPLQVGMEFDADIEVERRTIAVWFLEPIIAMVRRW